MSDGKQVGRDAAGGATVAASAIDATVGAAKGKDAWKAFFADKSLANWGKATSTPGGNALSVLSGGITALDHDPVVDGDWGWAEKAAVGGVDALWGVAGGPLAVIDSMLGGHVSGVVKGGTSAIAGALSGDQRAMGKATDAMLSGQHGMLADGVATFGAAIGDGIWDACDRDFEKDPIPSGEDYAIWMEAERRRAAAAGK